MPPPLLKGGCYSLTEMVSFSHLSNHLAFLNLSNAVHELVPSVLEVQVKS